MAEALESVRAQSWRDWECIVVDDGSTDDTRSVAKAFLESDARFKYLHQTNQGLSAARNAGIGVCKGAYIQFLDADDLLEKRKLEVQIAYLEEHTDTDIVYGNVRYFKEPGSARFDNEIGDNGDKRSAHASDAKEEVLCSLVEGNIMVVNSPLLRRSVLDDVGEFNRSLRGHEDWDYWLRCALAGKRFQHINEDGTFALVRMHHRSMSQNIVPMLMSNIKVREQLQNCLPRNLRKANNYQIGKMFARIAKFELSNGKLLLGTRHAFLAIWRLRLDVITLLYRVVKNTTKRIHIL